MIATDRVRGAVAAIHAVLVTLRTMAYEKADHELMAEALDSAEYLPSLMLEERGRHRYLSGQATAFGYHAPLLQPGTRVFDDAS